MTKKKGDLRYILTNGELLKRFPSDNGKHAYLSQSPEGPEILHDTGLAEERPIPGGGSAWGIFAPAFPAASSGPSASFAGIKAWVERHKKDNPTASRDEVEKAGRELFGPGLRETIRECLPPAKRGRRPRKPGPITE